MRHQHKVHPDHTFQQIDNAVPHPVVDGTLTVGEFYTWQQNRRYLKKLWRSMQMNDWKRSVSPNQ